MKSMQFFVNDNSGNNPEVRRRSRLRKQKNRSFAVSKIIIYSIEAKLFIIKLS